MNADQMGARFMRQQDWADPRKFKYPVTILGCGSHGSVAAIAAAKMGVPLLTLIDFDVFEAHNVPNQFCREAKDIGLFKAIALARLCQEMGAINPPVAVTGKLRDDGYVETTDGKQPKLCTEYLRGITISTPDNMVARKVLAEKLFFNSLAPWLIDSRQAGQHIYIQCVYTLDREQVSAYMKTLYRDEEATPEPCGARSVIDTTLHVGAWIGTLIRQIQTSQPKWRSIDLDVSKGEQTLALWSGEVVTNREFLALFTAV